MFRKPSASRRVRRPATSARVLSNAPLVLVLLAATTGCNALLDIGPTEASEDAGVAASAADALAATGAPVAGDGPWGCVGHVDLVETSSEPRDIHLSVVDLHSVVPNGLSIVACRPLTCDVPFAGPFGPDEDGTVRFSLPSDFVGYLIAESPTTLPAIIQITRPVGKMPSFPPIVLLNPELTAALALKAGAVLDPSRGIVLLQVQDCLDGPGPGISFVLQSPAAGAQVFYFANRYPSATETATDVVGGGGIVNVAPGFAGVEAIETATGRSIARFQVEVRAGWTTYAAVEPQ
jgi:hypothetical protein